MRMMLGMLAAVIVCLAVPAAADEATEREIRAFIAEGYEYSNKNNRGRPSDYSKDGALEFWSSGGMMHRATPNDSVDEYESFNVQPFHVEVTTLVPGQAAMAHFYAEGAFKPKGFPAVSHYFTRVTQVYVKEGREWKIRSSHFSPVLGGTGTSQTAPTE